MSGNRNQPYTIRHPEFGELPVIPSCRRSLALKLDREGRLSCRVPSHTPEREILGFIDEHRQWIERKRRELAELPPRIEPDFSSGSLFPYQGVLYPLVTGSFHGFENGAFHVVNRAQAPVKKELKKLYRTLALKHFQLRTRELAERFGFSFRELSLSNARRRWGSCNRAGELRLSWQLVMCPPDLIDYVIIHELAHTEEMNHGPAFHARIAAALPRHRELRARLRQHAGEFSTW